MTKRLDISEINSQIHEDPLANKLTEILKERQALKLRTQELERMVQKNFFFFIFFIFQYVIQEADIRQRIDQRSNANNQLLIDQTTLESMIDDLLLHKRQDSTDSGLDDGGGGKN